MGGVIIGHEMGRALGVEAMFVERPTGTFELRRGFRLEPGQKVLLVEDVVTTGLSSREAIEAVEAGRRRGDRRRRPGRPVGRRGRSRRALLPARSASTCPTYAADELPPELAAIPAEKPGSRKAA